MLSLAVDAPLSTLAVVAAAIAFAWACGRAVRVFGQPLVIGELIAGIALGPSVFGALSPTLSTALFTPAATSAISYLASAAILVFMFLVGLELDTSLLRRHARGVLRIASFSLLVPFALGVIIASLLYPSWHGVVANRTAFILFGGTAMSITAMPVLTRILADLRMLTTTIGTVAIGCAAIDDVVAWTMLGFVVSMTRGEANLPVAIGLAAAYIGVMWLVARPLLARAVSLRDHRGGRTGWIMLVAAVAVLSAIASDRIGIHAVFGALAAGACVPRRPQVLEGLDRPLRRLTAPLLPAFFILIGLRTEIRLLSDATGWMLVLAIIMCATAGKLGASALAARGFGFSWRDALVIGALLNTRGLVELVALDIGRQLGILSPALFAMFVIMTFVTTLATVPIVKQLTTNN
jgi:Kef-type K+ transport system membrane component KefB